MRRYATLYWHFFLTRIKILMEYRINFFIGMSSTIAMQLAGILAIWVVMSQIPDLNGWTLAEIWLIYGLIILAQSMNHMFADNLWTLGWQYVRTGNFDRFLVRPIDPLFHLLADRFNHDGIGHFVSGTILVTISSVQLGLHWSFLELIYLVIIVISGGLIFFSLNLIMAVSSFWVMDSTPIIRMIFEMHEFAKYPITIYPEFIRVILTAIIPFALASYYPASYLIGRSVSPLLALAAPAASVTLLFIGYNTWKFGLRHYKGTGS
jgi:ABC-2 type transport system permease protein